MTALPPATLRPRRSRPPLPSPNPHRPAQQQQQQHEQYPPSLWSEVNTQWSTLSSLASSVLSAKSESPPPRRRSKSPSVHTPAQPPPPPLRRPKTHTPPPSPHHHAPPKTLVYIHPVSAETTLSGVVIAFDTTASAVLRTNLLWPGDALQSRSELLIPVDECRIHGVQLPPLEEEEYPTLDDTTSATAEKRYRLHSRTLLPNNIGPTQVGVLLLRRAKRRKPQPPPPAQPPESPERPSWMTPGVHSFHPEGEVVLPEVDLNWGELLKGAEVMGGRVEGWMRKLGEGLRSTTAEFVGGELIEMVSGLGGEEAGENGSAIGRGEGTGVRRRKADKDA